MIWSDDSTDWASKVNRDSLPRSTIAPSSAWPSTCGCRGVDVEANPEARPVERGDASVHDEPKGLPIEPRKQGERLRDAFGMEAIERHRCAPDGLGRRRSAACTRRRSPILGTEHVAIAAGVAEVQEDADLVLLTDREHTVILADPLPRRRCRRTTGYSPTGRGNVKFASLGHTGTHLSQVRQSSSFKCRPIFRGGLFVAAWVYRASSRSLLA